MFFSQDILVDFDPLGFHQLTIFFAFCSLTDHLTISFVEKERDPYSLVMLEGLELKRNIRKFLLKQFVLEHFNDFKVKYSMNQLVRVLSSLIAKFSLLFVPFLGLKIYASNGSLSIKLSFFLCNPSPLCLFLYLLEQPGVILTHLWSRLLLTFLLVFFRYYSEKLLIHILLLLLLPYSKFFFGLFALHFLGPLLLNALFFLFFRLDLPLPAILYCLFCLFYHLISLLLL